MKKRKNQGKYQAWRGSFVDSYFGNLDNGEWVDIPLLKYLWLRINNFIVRRTLS